MEVPTDQLAAVELENKMLPPDRSAGLEQIFACLKSKDDTQRFVGLTLLMRYLEGIQGNYDLIVKCWHAIPGSFLTRLLRAKVTDDKEDVKSKEEAQIKFELGLTVLHTFISLLPTQQLQDLLATEESSEKVRRSWNLRINALVVEKPERYYSLIISTMSVEQGLIIAQFQIYLGGDNSDLALSCNYFRWCPPLV